MKTAYNFNAGPCVLPKEAIESTIAAIRDFDNTGIGLLEISHRTPGWERTMEETRQLWRDLLNIPLSTRFSSLVVVPAPASWMFPPTS